MEADELRPAFTDAEREKILSAALASREPLRLRTYPARFRKKLAVLDALAGLFEPGRTYSQAQVNELLLSAWNDPVTLRRDLVDTGRLARTDSGSAYWRP